MGKTRYPGVYQDPKGRFYYQVELGVDQVTGKRIQRKGRKDQLGKPFASAQEANKELTRVRNEWNQQGGGTNYNLTYRVFMEKYFIPAYKSNVEKSTFATHIHAFNHLIDRFGNRQLKNIRVIDCELYRTYLLTETGWSQGYCHLVYTAFRQSLDYAVRLNFLKENISRRTKSIPKGKAIVPFWTKEQFEKVISTIYLGDYVEHLYFVMLWTYFMTGIRVGEGLALTWDDVDLADNRMVICHSLHSISRHRYEVKPYTKTVNGMRTISLDDDTVKILKDWQAIQKEHGVDSFIFSYDGLPMSRSTLHVIIKRYAEKAGVPAIQPKGLRHSHVSYLINEFNFDVLTISRRLGHSSPEITLKNYAHLWSRNDEQIAHGLTGNITIKSPRSSLINFNGNQFWTVEKAPSKIPSKKEDAS